jgi:hypothetical protein
MRPLSHAVKALKRPVNQRTPAGTTSLRRPRQGGADKTLLRLLRKNPLREVLDLFGILGVNGLVIQFRAVSQLDL